MADKPAEDSPEESRLLQLLDQRTGSKEGRIKSEEPVERLLGGSLPKSHSHLEPTKAGPLTKLVSQGSTAMVGALRPCVSLQKKRKRVGLGKQSYLVPAIFPKEHLSEGIYLAWPWSQRDCPVQWHVGYPLSMGDIKPGSSCSSGLLGPAMSCQVLHEAGCCSLACSQ